MMASVAIQRSTSAFVLEKSLDKSSGIFVIVFNSLVSMDSMCFHCSFSDMTETDLLMKRLMIGDGWVRRL